MYVYKYTVTGDSLYPQLAVWGTTHMHAESESCRILQRIETVPTSKHSRLLQDVNKDSYTLSLFARSIYGFTIMHTDCLALCNKSPTNALQYQCIQSRLYSPTLENLINFS